MISCKCCESIIIAFRIDDNNYILTLHSTVLKKLEVEMDIMSGRYEDYRKVYEGGLGLRRKNRGKTAVISSLFLRLFTTKLNLGSKYLVDNMRI